MKWFGFPEDVSTMEPSSNVPMFIQEFYSDRSRLGQKLPNPRIKHTKTLTDGSKFHLLTWDGEAGGAWHGEDFFKMVEGDEEADFAQPNMPELTCGTRKSRDKRICR